MARAASRQARTIAFDSKTRTKHFKPERSLYVRLRFLDLPPPARPTAVEARHYSDVIYRRALEILDVISTLSFGRISGFPVKGVPDIVLNGSESDILAVLNSPGLKETIEGIYPNDPIDVTA